MGLPDFLPKVDSFLCCLDLKLGTIIICIFCAFGSLGVVGLGSAGPCGFGYAGEKDIVYTIMDILGYVQWFASICIFIGAILTLIYILFGVDGLHIGCEILAWGTFIGGMIIMIVAIAKTAHQMTNSILREVCKPLQYALAPIVIGGVWIYCGIVVNAFCGS